MRRGLAAKIQHYAHDQTGQDDENDNGREVNEQLVELAGRARPG